jgi:cyclophilin family peptidyl-prolyl cis-trans isomerase
VGKKVRSFRRSRLESLEARRVLAAPTLAALPAEITLLAGAPLHIALDGFDADSDSLTYSTSSTDSMVSAIIPKQETTGGNRSLRITVSHHLGTDTPDDTSDDHIESLGTMEFELFEGRASRATSRIIDLAESGWYDGKLFHRVISGFMIQGGSRNGDGLLGRYGDLPFDDQFDPSLQHTSAGLLSMAKGGDDTNNSQFFVTDRDTRWLDFNHTVFGLLTSGDDVRQAITAVPTDPSNWINGVNFGGDDRPLNDVVIESVEVFYDHEDTVMMLAALEGASGEADVTVTVDDGNGGTAQRTIHVVVEPDTVSNDPYANGNPYLEDIDPIWVDFDTPRTFSLDVVDVEGDQLFYYAGVLDAGNDLDAEVSSDGELTIVPSDGVTGVFEIELRVGPSASSLIPDKNGRFDESITDKQVVPVFVRPPAPTVELDRLSDTGDPDDVTAINNGEHNLGFVISGVALDATVWLEADGVTLATNEVSRTPADDGSGTYDVLLELTGDELADGVYEYRTGQTVALTGEYDGVDLTSDLSGLLSVTIDTSDPVIGSDPVLFVNEGEEYRYQVQATDGDNTNIRYEVQTPYPGMQQDPETGVITWTPDVNQTGIRPLVVFAIDGAGNTGRQEFDIQVNASLQIAIEGDTEAAEETTLSFLVRAWAPDDLDAAVDISLHGTTLPGGATYSLTKVDDNSARFEWTIAEEDGPGEYDVTFRATNPTDATVPVRNETFTITATEVNVSPELTVVHQGWTPGEWLSISEDEALLLDIAATDPDLPANHLVFSLAGDVPDGASIDPKTGEFTWTPSELQGGLDLDMIVRVTDSGELSDEVTVNSDSGGLSDEVTVNIAVEEVNSPPVFDPVETQTTFEGLDIEVEVTARDPDVPANTIRYSLVEGEFPEGATIDAETGKITWEVPKGFLEDHDPNEPVNITVKAEEVVPAGEESLSALTTVEVTVADSLEGLLAGVALTHAAQTDPFSPAPDASSGLPVFSETPSGESAGTPLAGTPPGDTSDFGSNGSSLFDPLLGSGGSSGGGGGQGTKLENESEKKDESDDKEDSDETKADMSKGADVIEPSDVVSSELNAAAIEEYLDNEESADESGRQANQTSESSGDGERIEAEDEALRVYVEELVAAVAENETAGS